MVAVKKFFIAALFLGTFLAISQAAWGVDVGELAPQFSATDTHARRHSLADYQGRYVVLEWHNRDCPYVQKHYDSGNMQRLQKYWTSKGVVWLTVISSAPGEPGYVTAGEENQYLRKVDASPTAVLLDPTGELGHLYQASTTPEMFVISPGGKLIYRGAIDDFPSVAVEDIDRATNYVMLALQQSLAGQHVTPPETPAYGYTVKYAR